MIPFDAASTAYSQSLALHCAELSALAYLPAEAACDGARALGYDLARFIDSGSSSQVLIAASAAHLVAAFRGTEWQRIEDWERDGAACLVPGPGSRRVHRGFLRALQEVEDELEMVLADLGPGRALWLTGHSLGGAVATLAAAYLALEVDRPVHGVYTYGSPRVGSRGFADLYDGVMRERTWRVARAGDLVTRVPPRVAGYSHVGSDLFISVGGAILTDPAGWLQELNCVEANLEVIGHLELAGIAEHEMDGYRRALSV